MSVLSKGSIKQQFASGLAAALLLSGTSAAIVSAQSANDTPENKSSQSAELQSAEVQSSAEAPSDEAFASNDAASGSEVIQPAAELTPSLSEDILVHAHEIDGRQAATLFVKDIPVLTFIGTEVNSLSNSSDAVSLAISDASLNLQADAAPAGDLLNSELEADPVLRATNLGSQIDPAAVNAEDISVRWHEETDGYIVTMAGEDLIELDSRTVLALSLRAALNAPISETRFGVFRM